MDESTTSILEQAKQEREKLEKLLPTVQENVKQLQELEARRLLGGKTDAGQPAQPKVEIDPREYAQKALRGQI